MSWWAATIGGAMAGCFVIIALSLINISAVNALSVYTSLGAGAGFVFWLVWRQGYADRARAKAQAAPSAPIA